ncbi:MAG: hypothetical protein ACTHLY_02440 [Pseudolabrys sp.]
MARTPHDHGFDGQGFNGLDRRPGRPRLVVAGLLTSAGLLVALIIAATAVSAGIAQADALGALVDHEAGVFAIALLLGTLFIASCFTKAMMPRRNARRDGVHADTTELSTISRRMPVR